MKLISITIASVLFAVIARSQTGNIGIGTSSPTAKLQLHHKNSLASPVITLFDSTAGTGSRIRFAKQGISSQFHIVSTLTGTSAANSLDFLQGTTSLLFLQGDGKIGVNNSIPVAALDVNGDVNIRGKILANGDAGTAGQVLVSNGTAADPEWRNSAISGGGKIAFTYNTNSNNSGRTGYNNAAGFIQTDSLDYNALLYNIGSDFTITTAGLTGNFITINTTGTYHFEGLIKFFATNANPALPRAALKFRYDPPSAAFSEFIIREEVMREFNNSTTGGVNHDLGLGIPFSLDFFLVAGTTVTIMTELQPNNFPYLVLGVSSGGYIKGYRVTD